MNMKLYMKQRREERKTMAKNLLGDKCVKCGSKDNLQFDHIDPKTKIDNIGEMFSHSVDKLLEELKKCQLLCQICHSEKSIVDMGFNPAVHGSLSGARWCKPRYEPCKVIWNKYTRDYRLTHPRKD